MKKIFISCVLFLLFSTLLLAKENYIQVMSISDSNYLNGVKHNIEKLGYKTYIKKKGKWHTVYVGPFKNTLSANKALSIVKKRVSKDAFLTKITIATPKKAPREQTPIAEKKNFKPIEEKITNKKILETQKQASTLQENKKSKVTLADIMPIQDKTITSLKEDKKTISQTKLKESKVAVEKNPIIKQVLKKPTPSVKKQEAVRSQKAIIPQNKKEKSFYIGLSGGISMLNITKNDTGGSVPLSFELEDSGINYGLEIGYYINNSFFISLNYQKTDLQDVSLSNAFASLNYQLEGPYAFLPYIGLLAGYSGRTWEESPLASVRATSTVSSLLGGLQIGSDISIYESLSLYLYYRYLYMDTTTNIYTPTGESEIKYSSEQNLNMGIKYNF